MIAILQIEEEFLQLSDSNDWGDGTTLVIAVIRNNHLVIANVGDSECIIASNGKAFALTEIHNPSKNNAEILRVQNAGGRIIQDRVGHPALNINYFNLGLSRAMFVFYFFTFIFSFNFSNIFIVVMICIRTLDILMVNLLD